ncbi:hypothetical protein DVK85_05380 [Flavobacterium arcticum]|uniref:O-antigen ligase-related domain-containing protein n=1 Tax=Flavobacterium arcticum TaxID=1784713 RepID=A0A345HAT2_9FLAO|nr:O-antigen ligase family protein [Flavobacterium arcticum]AXG73692.1 hypothetical protein DVK85_05380 [Flavobacterium arcticum]KAF2511643.1 hypothetical protein E0W72_04890 [Flavobacterium arcticum]
MIEAQNTNDKIKAKKVYAPIFVLLLLLQLYLPSFKINIVVQVAALLFFCFAESKILISKKFLGQFTSVFLLLILGFIGTLLHKYRAFNIIKDLFHFIKPAVGILIGYLFFRKMNDFSLFIKTIVIASVLSAFIHLYIVFFITDFFSGQISNIRLYTKDNFLELFAIFFLVFYKKYEGKQLFSNYLFRYFSLGIISLSCILYFSRTMIVIAILLLVTIYGYTKITKKSLVLASIGVVLLSLLFVYLNNANIRRDKEGIEGFLYKIKMAPGEIFVGNINRENHADLWDHWRAYEAKRAYALMEENPSSFVVGTGHGSLVNLKFFVPVPDNLKGMKYVSELHNGYMYVFYKIGAIGILLYLFILLRWYSYIYKRNTMVNMLVSAIGTIYLFSSITITGIFNGRDIIIFILGAALYYSESAAKTKAEVQEIQQ